MNEKFYSSKYLTAHILVQFIMAISFLIISIEQFTISKKLPYLTIIFLVLAIFVIVLSLEARNKPTVTIMDKKLIFRPYCFYKREVDFGQIISGSIKGGIFELTERIKIEFKRSNNKVGSFSIYLCAIDNHERLIDILKQHIKFE